VPSPTGGHGRTVSQTANPSDAMTNELKHHVVIVGGGFAGLRSAQALRKAPVQVTLIDRRNFHLFQPLLYQVATGGLSAADIASPLRGVLRNQKNACVLQGEVTGIDMESRRVFLGETSIAYDTLILATGSGQHYFGRTEWKRVAPGLKSIEDAMEIRRRVFNAFEQAERETVGVFREPWMTFVIVGGGPTGVELAGAIGELAHHTLPDDFRRIDTTRAQVYLLEGNADILKSYDPSLSSEARRSLERLGVTVRTGCAVTDVCESGVTIRVGEQTETIPARTVLWAAGVQASPLGKALADAAGADIDRLGRVMVQADLTVPGYPDVFVLGDLAHVRTPDGSVLPSLAPVAMQQGAYVARVIQRRLRGQAAPPFRYRDRGKMAVIGRSAAVAEIGNLKLHGLIAWLSWLFIHVLYLVEFENRLLVTIQWGWNYFTRNRSARLITETPQSRGSGALPRAESQVPEGTEVVRPLHQHERARSHVRTGK
jgi:NADH:ubiquinone reductase (H+-translocating)